MHESPEEIAELQQLMNASHARGTSHLQEIVSGDRRLSAAQVVAALHGMKVLSLATVTARGGWIAVAWCVGILSLSFLGAAFFWRRSRRS